LLAKREFTVADEYHYNWSGPIRWIASHTLRYKFHFFFFVAACIGNNIFVAAVSVLAGEAFNAVFVKDTARAQLLMIALSILGVIVLQGLCDIGARLLAEVLSNRITRDAREELYTSLLGKSQTFHNRQRVGDIMARASNDMTQVGFMICPGVDTLTDSFSSLIVSLIFIGFVNVQLLLIPAIYCIIFCVSIRYFTRQLNPVSVKMRDEFGQTNAVLNEAVTGIEVVKATAQEKQEIRKFMTRASRYRDFYVQNGTIQGRYIPTLILSVALALGFLHGLYLLSLHQISLGVLITFIGLMLNFRYVTSVSPWSFGLTQIGIAGARRILALIKEETELDENSGGHHAEMHGEIIFDHVTFSYGDTPVLKDISFRAKEGQTVAIVGQTGTGKSTLTKLVNRIYDVNDGQVLIDGIDVRNWDLDALRSQISTIEQDVFLFARTIAENISYGQSRKADQDAIETAAQDAQAHEFIQSFPQGYDTEIGERGVTLSGGQRQRLAIARALLTNPRILILDDSTSAVDSATEDEIQKAIRRLLQGRTTLLITHRLSQIRWADSILVLQKGEVIDQGTHEELLGRCDIYRRIFSHYDAAIPTTAASRSE
jgi:ATP-binding cassette subfamily B protein